MSKVLSVLEMEILSEDQFSALRQLKVSKRQEVLGKSFLESIHDWETAPKDQVLGLCLLIDSSPIGLVLFRRQTPEDSGTISVHGLKIALPWQRQGYGHQAFHLAIKAVKSEWSDAALLNLTVDAENQPALQIYRKFAMSDSGPSFDGSNGKEHRMEVSLRS